MNMTEGTVSLVIFFVGVYWKKLNKSKKCMM